MPNYVFARRALVAALLVALSACASAAGTIDFVRDVEPIFAAHCHACHGRETQESGLRLTGRKVAFDGGDSGHKAIVPGDLAASRLLQLVSAEDAESRMPPPDAGNPLTPEEIATLTRWIVEGAVWPDDADVTEALVPAHWAWQKPLRPPLPPVERSSWPLNGIDYFVLGRLEREGLAPSPAADRYVLARRVSLDLVGLPPTPEQLAEFIADEHPDAYERYVDRLLADSAYGERWARMWLDLARYADSKGYGSDPLRTIWRYRDWVIEAFNRNLPYDRFTTEQLAGDLLPSPTAEQLLATAFHRNTMANDEGGTDDEEFRVAAIKDRVDTTAQVWMGLTLGCAKCHSHKYDPITQREYYQFYAFFNQTADADRGDEEPRLATPTAEQADAIARLQAQLDGLRQKLATTTPELAAAQAAWESAVAERQAHWTPLVIESATAADGAPLERLPDGSLLATGPANETDIYTIVASAAHAGATALRLEVLPHESLPSGGPGRSSSGNFVLNELRASAAAVDAAPPRGRYVRIELPSAARILSLAEVQVFRGAENVAQSGTAAQSSVDFDGPANLAIDGNTDGRFDEAKSTTHTREEDNPWWEVDLGAAGAVDRIVVFNRTDGDVGGRLSDFRLLLLDDARQSVWQADVAAPPAPSASWELGGPAPLSFTGATADFSQAEFGIEQAVDGDAAPQSGWAVAPRFGAAREAVLPLAQPLSGEGPARLTISLEQTFGGAHTLGRLRLSTTTAHPVPAALPAEVTDVLAVAAELRTPDQAAALAAYYRSIAAELDDVRALVAGVEQQLNDLQAQVPTTPVLRELPPDQRRETRMLVKGNFLTPADAVETAVPAAFHPLPAGAPTDRLGLAQWLTDRDNPLTARVAVNRFWAQLFGLGIVETEEDFGTQGLPPSHPELLDWLAVEFASGGWDVKALLKLVVASATYRQSSSPAAELLARDPYNRLLARGPRFRLEAEMVRDQALALSGLLSRKQGGPSVYPPQPDGLWRAAFNGERTWATSVGPDRYRRGLYTYWRRTVPYPSMSAFDAPSREICTVRRVSTNTPLQAFVTLNDPGFVEMAQALGRRIVRDGGATTAERAAFALRLCLCRPPHDDQVRFVADLFESEAAHYRQRPAEAQQLATDPLGPLPDGMDAAEMAAWTVVGNVLLNMDGVLTKR